MTDYIGDIVVRRAALHDVPAMVRIESHSFTEPWSAEEITKDVTKGGNVYVAVAEDAGETVGYVDIWAVGDEAQLYNIVVDQSKRGRHIGRTLMQHAVDVCRKAGCSVMTLEVRASNTPAINMYHSLGFEDVGVRRAYYRDNHEDAILMNKDLTEVWTNHSNDLEVEVI